MSEVMNADAALALSDALDGKIVEQDGKVIEKVEPLFLPGGPDWNRVLALASQFDVPTSLHKDLGVSVTNAASLYCRWINANHHIREAQLRRSNRNDGGKKEKPSETPKARMKRLAKGLRGSVMIGAELEDPLIQLRLMATLQERKKRSKGFRTERKKLTSALSALNLALTQIDVLIDLVDEASSKPDTQFAGWAEAHHEIREAVPPLRAFWIQKLKQKAAAHDRGRGYGEEGLDAFSPYVQFLSQALALIDGQIKPGEVYSAVRTPRKDSAISS